MNFGYVRVSTTEQNIDRQILAMNERGIENIYIDKFTGINFEDRPNYQKLKRRLKKGDVLFIKSLDRFGRKYTAVLEEWRYLAKKGVAVVVMDMPILDTRNKDGNLMGRFVSDLVLQILSFVAEQEYRNIHERQRQGIEAAKKAGVRFGRPPQPIPANFMEEATKWANGEISIKKGAKACGMSDTRFYMKAQKYLAENKIKVLPMEERPWYHCQHKTPKELCEIAKQRRERLLSEGICPSCGKRPLEESYKMCHICRMKARESARKSYRKKAVAAMQYEIRHDYCD